MFGKGWGWCVGCIALGAVGAVLVMKNKEKIKPMASQLVAKSMRLKDKALACVEKTKECAEDIVAEARHINEAGAEA
jgi:hypothetical protein